MTWTASQLRNSRSKYQRLYAAPVRVGIASHVTVPDDVQRVETHVPCLACGQARGPCAHRWWA